MNRAVLWLRQNRYSLLGALLGGAIVGLIGAPLAFGGGVIGFAAGHYADRRAVPAAVGAANTTVTATAINRPAAVIC